MKLIDRKCVSGKIKNSILIHSNKENIIYISGNNIIISNIENNIENDFILEGHNNSISCLSLSNNGKLIASGQIRNNSDILIWDFNTKKILYKLSEHDFEITNLKFSHDDKLLFSCGNIMDKKMFIWDTSNGNIVANYNFNIIIEDIDWGFFKKDVKWRDTDIYQFATCGEKVIDLYYLDPIKGSLKKNKISTGGYVREYTTICFSKDLNYLCVGTKSADILLYNLKTSSFKFISQIQGNWGVFSLFSYNNYLMIGFGNGFLGIFNFNNFKFEELEINNRNFKSSITTISNIEKIFYFTTINGSCFKVTMEDNLLKNRELKKNFHSNIPLFVKYFENSDDCFATSSKDFNIKFWKNNNIENILPDIKGNCEPNCFFVKEDIILSGWNDNSIKMHNLNNSGLIWNIKDAHKEMIINIELSKDNRNIITSSMDAILRVWDLRSRSMKSNLKEHNQKITKIKLFNDDKNVISCSYDKSILIWDWENEKRVQAFYQNMGGINTLDILEDKKLIISSGLDRKISLWDINSGKLINKIEAKSIINDKEEIINCLEVLNFDKGLATGGTESNLKLWDFKTNKIIEELKGHSRGINSLTVSNNRNSIITVGFDQVLNMWNLN